VTLLPTTKKHPNQSFEKRKDYTARDKESTGGTKSLGGEREKSKKKKRWD
jgi:hypothetical protein